MLIKFGEDSKCPFCLIVCGREDLTLDLFPGLREYFSQTDEVHTVPRIPVMHAMVNSVSMKDQKLQESETKIKQTDNKILDMVDEESEDDDDYQVPQADLEVNIIFYSHALKHYPNFYSFPNVLLLVASQIKFHCNSCTGRTYQI